MTANKNKTQYNPKVTMKGCKVCNHTARQDIEISVITGQNTRDIADHITATTPVKIHYQSINRHWKYHVEDELKKNVSQLTKLHIIQTRNTNEELQNLFDDVDELIEYFMAEETGDFS